MVCPDQLGGVSARLHTSDLFGIPVCAGSPDEILAEVWERLKAGQVTHIVTLNPEIVMQAEADPGCAELIRGADIIVADGQGIAWAARRFGLRNVNRYPGIDLVHDLMGLMAKAGRRVFLLGSEPGVAEEAARILRQEMPGLVVSGTADGYFELEDSDAVIDGIKNAEPDLLLVGMGFPRQDRFIAMNRERLNIPVMVGVGGALDVFAGKVRRAPVWLRRCGLEWFYRAIGDTKRLRRMMVLPRFIGMTVRRSFRRGE